MARLIAAVVAGYIAIALFTIVTFTAMWMIGGPAFAFRGESLAVTLGWSTGAMILSFAGAVVGGLVARSVAGARSDTALRALAVLLVVLGLGLAIAHVTMKRPAAPKPVTEMSSSEAATYAQAPAWFDFTVPFVGAAGVLLTKKRRNTNEPAVAAA
jgi:hypothetical protein